MSVPRSAPLRMLRVYLTERRAGAPGWHAVLDLSGPNASRARLLTLDRLQELRVPRERLARALPLEEDPAALASRLARRAMALHGRRFASATVAEVVRRLDGAGWS